MDDNAKKPIFYDPEKKRWFRVKCVTFSLLLFLILPVVIFLATTFIKVPLTKISISSVNSFKYIKLKNTTAGDDPPKHNQLKQTDSLANVTDKDYKYKIGLLDANGVSFTMFKENADKLNMVIGNWLFLANTKSYISQYAPESGFEKKVSSFVKKNNANIKILGRINNYNDDNPALIPAKLTESILSTSASRDRLIASLLSYVLKNQFAGITIDFDLTDMNEENFVKFIEDLSATFHSHHLLVMVNVQASEDGLVEAKSLVNIVDNIIVLGFDEHSETDTAGPISSLSWFESEVKQFSQVIPNNKLIIALGNYGYDWVKGKKLAKTYSFSEIMQLAKLASAVITFDPQSLNPRFNYKDEHNKLHQVWFLDAVTAFNEMVITQKFNPIGIAVSALGTEDPSLWNIFAKKKLGKTEANQILILNTEKFINSIGQNPVNIITVSKDIKIGQRQTSFDANLGIINNEEFKVYPTSFLIKNWGGKKYAKEVALTFDDGPNPDATPPILDILEKTKTPATFFVIGGNALNNPDLLKREYDAGFDIGNHTLTHPDISKLSLEHAFLEVNSTERIIAGIIGRITHLFRPPYGVDADPSSDAETAPIVHLSKLGYLTVGIDIDTEDWNKPGVNYIVEQVLNNIKEDSANIVVLHDGGGDRSQTIAALPIIIDKLTKEGYHFVSISQLLKVSPAESMPIINADNRHELIYQYSVKLLYIFTRVFVILFLASVILGIGRFALTLILGIYQKYFDKHDKMPIPNLSVTAVISAYNEEKVILKSINSLLDAKHPKDFKILIINDGSTDNTLNILKEHFGNNPLVTIISQVNSGKAAALNYAIEHCNSDLIITLDADTVINKIGILELMRPFSDPKVAAVAGYLRVGNQINILTKWQTIEYIIGQNLDRRSYKIFNAIPVVPGAVGAWKRTVLIEVGGYSRDTLTEDFDLTFKARRLGYVIALAQNAIGSTEAPDTIKTFLRQRYRWTYGTFQSVAKHIDTIFNYRYGSLGFFVIPNIFVVVFTQLIAPIMDLMLILITFGLVTAWMFHPLEDFNTSFLAVLWLYVGYQLAEWLLAFIAFLIDGKEKLSLLKWVLIQRFCYRQLIYYIVYKTLRDALRGKEVWWGKPERKSTVQIES